MDEYRIVEHMSYNWMVVTYFFLGGLGAGGFILSVAANFWWKNLQPLAKTAAVVSVLSIALGMLFLLLDLGRPFGFWLVMVSFARTSIIFWGAWALNIFFVIGLAHIWLLQKGDLEKARKIAYMGLPFALFVGSYTALLLGQAPGRILWHSALLPIIFLLGGVISGTALVLLIAAVTGKSAVPATLNKFIAGLVAAELVLVGVELITLYHGSAEAVAMMKHLVRGGYSLPFWGVSIILGAVVPSAILLRNKVSSSAQAIASVLILIGIFTMRYIVVVGGQVPTF